MKLPKEAITGQLARDFNEWMAACGRKTYYRSEGEAQRRMDGNTPYKCRFCNGWHTTSRRN